MIHPSNTPASETAARALASSRLDGDTPPVLSPHGGLLPFSVSDMAQEGCSWVHLTEDVWACVEEGETYWFANVRIRARGYESFENGVAGCAYGSPDYSDGAREAPEEVLSRAIVTALGAAVTRLYGEASMHREKRVESIVSQCCSARLSLWNRKDT
jgi:hypothetical protein